jgi:hypothetical protein
MSSYLLVPHAKASGQVVIGGMLQSWYISLDKPFMITASLSADNSKVTVICPRIQLGNTSFLANFTIPVTK